tara:strand:- start:242 stop:454 length:213 start_codon:yes stop_codon:yes gene_type:complete
MSNLVKSEEGAFVKFGDSTIKEKALSLNVKDTDFILKLIMESTFKGTQLEQGYLCMSKIIAMHKGFLNED